jgi:hypothetical protein
MLAISRLSGQLTDMRTRLKKQKTALEGALAHINEMAACDELTGLPNRRRMLLPESAPGDPTLGVARLRDSLAVMQASPALPGLRVRFSAGFARHEDGEPVEQAIERADRALYAAKSAGRNRSVVLCASCSDSALVRMEWTAQRPRRRMRAAHDDGPAQLVQLTRQQGQARQQRDECQHDRQRQTQEKATLHDSSLLS